MFNNIGKKIKTLAAVICWIGIIFSIIGFLVMLIYGAVEAEGLFIGLSFAVLVVGGFGSWIGSFFAYGFGQLIENSDKIAGGKVTVPSSIEETADAESERIAKLKSLKEKGLITEEEYNKAVGGE